MSAPKRLTIKLFLDNPEVVTGNQIVAVFQRWIQQNLVDGLLIDVADYQHAHNGPGIILIGYDGDYAYDFADNRPGIQYTLKQTSDFSLSEALNITLGRVLQAANQLETEKLEGNPVINLHDLQITFRDRLNYPDNAVVRANTIAEVQALLGNQKKIEFLEDGSKPLTLAVQSSKEVSLALQ